MLFENPAVAAKLPFPYNIPPPMQAAAGVPQISATTIETANALIEHDLQSALIAINPLNGATNGFAAVNGSPPISAQTQIVSSATVQCQNGGGNTTTSQSGSSGRSTPTATSSSGSDPAPGKLFVGGLSWQTSSDKLKEYFGMFGTVTDVLIMKDPITQRSRGFGFITFTDPASVEKVLKVPIHTLDGKKIDPKHATPKNRPKQANKTKKIFVGGVSQETSSEEVKAYFGQFGKVEETVMLMDQQTKRHRGFGFVTFENEDVVDRVCEIHFHTIKNKKVECKKAQPKEAVTPAAQLLQKRLMLGSLGVRIPTAPPTLVGGPPQGMPNPLTMAQVQAHAAQAHHVAAAALQAQSAAAAGGYGKIFSPYPPQAALHSFRYSPYPIPASAAAAHASTQQQQQPPPAGSNSHQQGAAAAAAVHQQHAAAAAMAAAQQPGLAGNPYQGYSLANVDMSSFQNVDWGSMYGLYV